MNDLQVFKNSEFGEIGVLLINGNPHFPATACAKILGYSSPRDAIRRHCDAEGVVKHDGVSHTTNQHGITTEQKVTTNFITEGNLYRLIVHSRLPAAKKFERWVFDEVLPTIRKQGTYGAPDQTAIIMQTATAVCAEMIKQLTPLFQSIARPPVAMDDDMILEAEATRPRYRKKPSSIIDRLCPEIRREVETMLCDGRYTYVDVAARLSQDGIKISTASICRYAKRNNCYAVYEVRD